MPPTHLHLLVDKHGTAWLGVWGKAVGGHRGQRCCYFRLAAAAVTGPRYSAATNSPQLLMYELDNPVCTRVGEVDAEGLGSVH